MTSIPQPATDYLATGDTVSLIDARFKAQTFTIEEARICDGLGGADMQKRGWEPVMYSVRGKRGAVHLAYRSAKYGTLHWVCSLR